MPATVSQFDVQMMRQAIGLAMNGRGAVEPNPMVGCVIVRDGRVIGEGFHRRFGGPHAEPDALNNCTESPQGATAYVTLEPCCHTAKKTPPCVPALIEANLARIVIGCIDPNPAVAGQGIDQLRRAGIQVDAGVLDAEARQLNAPFFARVLNGRPYVTLKWAQSADGKVAGPRGQRVWISNETSRRVVHELRARSDAILVGINTVLADDPLLTSRHVESPRPLLRVVLDRDLRISPNSQLVRTIDQGPVLVFCSEATHRGETLRISALTSRGVEVRPLPLEPSRQLSLAHALADLGARPSLTHLLIEPGPTLARSFIEAGLADRLWVFRSPTLIGDPSAPAAVDVPYAPVTRLDLAGDELTEHLNPQSSVYWAPEPSADMAWASRFSAQALGHGSHPR